MKHLRRSTFVRLVILPFTLTLWLTACSSYRTLSPPYEQSISDEDPGTVRVTMNDGSRWEISEPIVTADSLVGADNDSWDRDSRAYTRRVSIGLGEVSEVEFKKSDISTPAAVGLGLLGVLVVAWLVDCSGREGLDAIGCP